MQIRLEPAQYELLEREAARTGQSVGAVVREAIAVRLGRDSGRRAAAARRLLASADPIGSAGSDWSDAKHELEAGSLSCGNDSATFPGFG